MPSPGPTSSACALSPPTVLLASASCSNRTGDRAKAAEHLTIACASRADLHGFCCVTSVPGARVSSLLTFCGLCRRLSLVGAMLHQE